MKMRIPLRVVFYLEDGDWIARCLEFDLIGDGETREQALQCLDTAIKIQIEQSIRYSNPDNLFNPAEGKYLRMFSAGKDVAVGELHLEAMQIDDVHVESPQCRSYEAPPVQDSELARIG